MAVLLLIQGRQGSVAWCVTMMEYFNFGFYGSVGLSNILHAEIQALLVGIKLCWQAGLRKVMCFSDSLHVVQLVKEGTSLFHHYANELEIIRDFMKKDWTISLHHTFREGNIWQIYVPTDF